MNTTAEGFSHETTEAPTANETDSNNWTQKTMESPVAANTTTETLANETSETLSTTTTEGSGDTTQNTTESSTATTKTGS